MKPGLFSLSLSVKDLAKSLAFYEQLGFVARGGDADQGWLILENGDTKIGLFQGMFEKNTLTFNPGWDGDANTLPSFTDVRELRGQLADAGFEFVADNTGDSEAGPAHFIVLDPDGNPVLFDQHV
jgi:catechol 2,3-dioxygenase-like lactoylglutathione lyase family enzyme